MPLAIQPLPLIERWDCHQCGACCRGSVVSLSAEDLARLESQNWHQHPEFANTKVHVAESWLSASRRLAHRSDGSCVFLMPDGLCRIHKDFGFAAKPLVCRMFPLQIVPRDNMAVVTARRACPSAAADLGRPLADHLADARSLARERKLAENSPVPPWIKTGDQRSWKVTRRLLETIQRLLADEKFPLVRRLAHALALCRLLDQARTRSLTDDRLVELFGVLESSVGDEIGDLFTNRQAPTTAALVLFRQTAAEFVRLHPGFSTSGGWKERLRLAWAAWQLVRGRGELPRLHPKFPPLGEQAASKTAAAEATFEQLEQPLGRLDAAIYQPLNRLIETNAASWLYALANRSNWSITDSLRMLALQYPLGLWLLRWRSVGAIPSAEQTIEIVAALDRGQGAASLSGGKQRYRLRLLAKLQQLECLLAWYSR